jgi:hypothetical protein
MGKEFNSMRKSNQSDDIGVLLSSKEGYMIRVKSKNIVSPDECSKSCKGMADILVDMFKRPVHFVGFITKPREFVFQANFKKSNLSDIKGNVCDYLIGLTKKNGFCEGCTLQYKFTLTHPLENEAFSICREWNRAFCKRDHQIGRFRLEYDDIDDFVAFIEKVKKTGSYANYHKIKLLSKQSQKAQRAAIMKKAMKMASLED